MSAFWSTLIIFITLFSGVRISFAETLTWKECIQEASRSNPEIKSATQNMKAARFQKDSAFAGFLPKISGNGTYSHGNHSGTTLGSTGSTTSIISSSSGHDLYSISANAQQNIFSGFRDVAKVSEGKANENISKADLQAAKAKVSFDLKSAFSDLKYAQNSLKLTQDIMKRRSDNRNLVQLRFESGRENKGSLALSNAYWQQSKFDYLQASHTLETSQSNLARVLGRSQSTDLQITGDIPLSQPQELKDLDALSMQTPDYLRTVGQKKAAKALVKSSWANFFPTVDGTASVGRQDDHWIPEQNRWTVGLNVSIPIFSGGQNYFNLKSSKAKLLSSEYTRQNTSNTVKTNLTKSYRTYLESVQKLETDRAFLEAASIRAEIARQKYDNGLISFEDWDIIENDLIARQKTFYKVNVNEWSLKLLGNNLKAKE
ncbi:MAG: TolC family protein [Deltaproteobacteria bacterium]|nr:MAG: TolC family protein [Deltaproteobacteria bacterium]